MITDRLIEHVAREMCKIEQRDENEVVSTKLKETLTNSERQDSDVRVWAKVVEVPRWRKRRREAERALISHFAVKQVIGKS